jgi:hypothetical protein
VTPRDCGQSACAGGLHRHTNLAGGTEWNGELELLLVEDKDNLFTKVGRVSAPVVMDLLAVVLG